MFYRNLAVPHGGFNNHDAQLLGKRICTLPPNPHGPKHSYSVISIEILVLLSQAWISSQQDIPAVLNPSCAPHGALWTYPSMCLLSCKAAIYRNRYTRNK
jgi:hypothetical protein